MDDMAVLYVAMHVLAQLYVEVVTLKRQIDIVDILRGGSDLGQETCTIRYKTAMFDITSVM